MADWIEKFGMDAEKRALKVRTCRRIRIFGMVFLFFTVLMMLYVILVEKPQNHSDVFLFAITLSVCFAAAFSVITEMETEIKLCGILDHLEAKNRQAA